MKNDDVLFGHLAEESTSQPRLDKEISRTVALLKADDEPQRGLDRSQERHVDHRGAIKPIRIPGNRQPMTDDAQEAKKHRWECAGTVVANQ